MGVYVGDLFCVEPELTIESARHVIKELRALLGLELSPDKEVPHALPTMLLGAQIELSRGFARAAIPWSQASNVIEEIKAILKENALSPYQASELRGN